jgi:hypothetical protein
MAMTMILHSFINDHPLGGGERTQRPLLSLLSRKSVQVTAHKQLFALSQESKLVTCKKRPWLDLLVISLLALPSRRV